MEPGAIRSRQSERATRIIAAWKGAVLPVAQSLFAFMIGMPVRLSW
jgi:hypothetical protein